VRQRYISNEQIAIGKWQLAKPIYRKGREEREGSCIWYLVFGIWLWLKPESFEQETE
jgi:hypothetical protein